MDVARLCSALLPECAMLYGVDAGLAFHSDVAAELQAALDDGRRTYHIAICCQSIHERDPGKRARKCRKSALCRAAAGSCACGGRYPPRSLLHGPPCGHPDPRRHRSKQRVEQLSRACGAACSTRENTFLVFGNPPPVERPPGGGRRTPAWRSGGGGGFCRGGYRGVSVGDGPSCLVTRLTALLASSPA